MKRMIKAATLDGSCLTEIEKERIASCPVSFNQWLRDNEMSTDKRRYTNQQWRQVQEEYFAFALRMRLSDFLKTRRHAL